MVLTLTNILKGNFVEKLKLDRKKKKFFVRNIQRQQIEGDFARVWRLVAVNRSDKKNL